MTWNTLLAIVPAMLGAVTRALNTLTWRGSPIVLLALFIVIWLGHAITRALATAATAWVARLLPRRLRSATP